MSVAGPESRSRRTARRAQEKSTFKSIQERSADAKLPAGLLPAALPSDAESAAPGVQARRWLAACLVVYSRRSRALNLKFKKSTVLRMFQFHLGDFCHTPLRSFPPCVPRGVLCSLNQKCGPTDGCCNNAHLLLPPPTWTSNHSAVPPPLPSLRSHFAVLQLCVG